jgi:hypothetical protein
MSSRARLLVRQELRNTQTHYQLYLATHLSSCPLLPPLNTHMYTHSTASQWADTDCSVTLILLPPRIALRCHAAALPHMLSVVRSRPAFFPSMPAALEWAVRSGACKCAEMAGVSLPSQLVEAPAPTAAGSNTCMAASGATGTVLTWRTPLEPSRLYWEGWYKGLSEAFLALPVPKMLLLAGTDRLDKVLTIGQMQGRFQLVLLPTAGHAIQARCSREQASNTHCVMIEHTRTRAHMPAVNSRCSAVAGGRAWQDSRQPAAVFTPLSHWRAGHGHSTCATGRASGAAACCGADARAGAAVAATTTAVAVVAAEGAQILPPHLSTACMHVHGHCLLGAQPTVAYCTCSRGSSRNSLACTTCCRNSSMPSTSCARMVARCAGLSAQQLRLSTTLCRPSTAHSRVCSVLWRCCCC